MDDSKPYKKSGTGGYMKLFTQSLLAASIITALGGCGGGGSSGDSTTPPEPKTTLQIRAIDGVLQGALVWIDLNGNGLRDAAEPSAKSDSEGRVLFTLEPGQARTNVYVETIPGETVDLERGPVDTAFTMVAPAGSGSNGAERVVSPLTTLLHLETQKYSDLAQAREALAQRLGISSDMLDADFVALGDGRALFIAKVIADALPASLPAEANEQDVLRLALNNKSGQATAIYDKLTDEQITVQGAPTLKSEINYNTHKATFTIEFATRKTEGGVEVSQGTKYYWDKNANDYERYNGKPLIATTWSLETTRKADGIIERYAKWEHDFNKDGERNFKGQSLSVGNDTKWVEYFDEDTNCKELNEHQCNDPKRIYEGRDLRAEFVAQDYSTIDFVQMWTKNANATGHDIEMIEYKTDAPTRDWFKPDNPGQPGFRRLEHYAKEGDGVRITHESDWNADGSINQRESLLSRKNGTTRYESGKIVWANPLDDSFEEYADYNFHTDTRLPYWYENVVESIPLGDGLQQLTMEGKRYLLDEEKQLRKSDDSHPDGYLFHQYKVQQKEVSADEQQIHVTWQHIALDGYDFNRNDIGQEFKVMRRHKVDGDAMKGWWIGHNYAELGSQAVDNLPSKVLALLAEGKSFAQITAAELPGLGAYDQVALSGPLFTTAFKGYLVTNDSWLGASGKQKMTVNGQRVGTQDLLLQQAGGMTSLVVLKGIGSEPCAWWTCWEQRITSLDGVDPAKGIMTFKRWSDTGPFTTLYLREADADVAMAP
ncbi:hypothetical protein ACTG2E_20960 [Aeromonas veronii]